jgi:hypothetical protein
MTQADSIEIAEQNYQWMGIFGTSIIWALAGSNALLG